MDNDEMLFQTIDGLYTSLTTIVQPPLVTTCPHSLVQGQTNTCLLCGAITAEYTLLNTRLVTAHTTRACNYSAAAMLPVSMAVRAREITIDMFNHVTFKVVFRSKFKRVLLATCALYAYTHLENMIEFFRYQEFQLTNAELVKGVIFMADKLHSMAHYLVKFDPLDHKIFTILFEVGLEDQFKLVKQFFLDICYHSELLNVCQIATVLYGCSYFLAQLVPQLRWANGRISNKTLTSVYLRIKQLVFRKFMPFIFSDLLQASFAQPIEGPIPQVLANTLLADDLVTTVLDWTTTKIRVVDGDFTFPLNEVTNLLEWNMLLDRTFFTHQQRQIVLGVRLCEKKRDLFWDFSRFCSDQPGQKIIDQHIGVHQWGGLYKQFIDK